jgi:hypothetical protein
MPDERVRHIWQCEDEDCDRGNPCIEVGPGFYVENGEPVCQCGEEMVYVRTEVKV